MSGPDALSEITSYRAIGTRLGTAGQPTPRQLAAVRAAGFEAVINLAVPTSQKALPDEGSIVAALGMSYVHIPVDFKAPTSQDLNTFCHMLRAFGERRVFVHCALNMRVSAFVFLYRVLREGVAPEAAEPDLRAIWEPDAVWSRFIAAELARGAERAG